MIIFGIGLHTKDGRALREEISIPEEELLDCKSAKLRSELVTRHWSNWAYKVEPIGANHLLGCIHYMKPDTPENRNIYTLG